MLKTCFQIRGNWNEIRGNVDIFCLLSDDIQDRNDITTGGQNDWRERGLYIKRQILEHRISARTTDICLI